MVNFEPCVVCEMTLERFDKPVKSVIWRGTASWKDVSNEGVGDVSFLCSSGVGESCSNSLNDEILSSDELEFICALADVFWICSFCNERLRSYSKTTTFFSTGGLSFILYISCKSIEGMLLPSIGGWTGSINFWVATYFDCGECFLFRVLWGFKTKNSLLVRKFFTRTFESLATKNMNRSCFADKINF